MSENVGAAFPDGFTWGVATSAYQIEGAVREDGRGESIWDRFSHTPGRVANGDAGDIACDHYHRYRDDVQLMRELNVNAYRFSVAWPRILPSGTGAVNEAGLDFYERLVEEVLKAGLDPYLTLYHWDLPQVLDDRGGWLNRRTAEAFAAYTDVLTRRLGDRVKNWITINEPWVVAFLGYGIGIHAPGHRSMTEALQAGHHVLLAHGRAMDVIRSNVGDVRAGITLNLSPAYAMDPDREADQQAAHNADVVSNRWFLDPVHGDGYPDELPDILGATEPTVLDGDMAAISVPTDFLGINFYMPSYASATIPSAPGQMLHPDPDVERTALGWPVEPASLTDLLLRVTNDYGPDGLYITENGAAYDGDQVIDGRVSDPKRTAYFEGHLGAVASAIEAGAPVRGYFAWSMLDNFEWAEGYRKRFGIVYTDYATQERTIKDSGRYFAQVAAADRLP